MDFSEGHWDIIDIIMKMKSKEEYLDKVEKRARNNFSRVLNVIEKSCSSSMEYTDNIFYAENREYKLDKSKKFFTTVNQSGKRKGQVRKIYPNALKDNEYFMNDMEEEYEDYENWGQFDIDLILPYAHFDPIHNDLGDYEPTHRQFPKGLSLEEFIDYYIWINGIHYEIRYSNLHNSYKADWKYQEERPKKILLAVRDIEDRENWGCLDKHKQLFNYGSEGDEISVLDFIKRLKRGAKHYLTHRKYTYMNIDEIRDYRDGLGLNFSYDNMCMSRYFSEGINQPEEEPTWV